MKNLVLYLFLASCILLDACKTPGDTMYAVKVINQSSKPISFVYSKLYPDTTLPAVKPHNGYAASGHHGDILSRYKWKKVYEDVPSDTISFFIIDSDVMTDSSWTSISSKYQVLKRYDLSLQDLERSNYTITYP